MSSNSVELFHVMLQTLSVETHMHLFNLLGKDSVLLSSVDQIYRRAGQGRLAPTRGSPYYTAAALS